MEPSHGKTGDVHKQPRTSAAEQQELCAFGARPGVKFILEAAHKVGLQGPFGQACSTLSTAHAATGREILAITMVLGQFGSGVASPDRMDQAFDALRTAKNQFCVQIASVVRDCSDDQHGVQLLLQVLDGSTIPETVVVADLTKIVAEARKIDVPLMQGDLSKPPLSEGLSQQGIGIFKQFDVPESIRQSLLKKSSVHCCLQTPEGCRVLFNLGFFSQQSFGCLLSIPTFAQEIAEAKAQGTVKFMKCRELGVMRVDKDKITGTIRVTRRTIDDFVAVVELSDSRRGA